MSLDMLALNSQVRAMGRDLAHSQSDFLARVRWARRLLQQHSGRYRSVAAAIGQSRQTRTARAAVPMNEPLATRVAAPPAPPSYVAAACDGSHREPDRHGHVAYYLINTGTALIRYGSDGAASLRNAPRLYHRHEDLVVVEERQPDWPSEKQPREIPIDADILAMKRSLIEIEDLARLTQNLPPHLPAVLMVDGTLTLYAKSGDGDAWIADQFRKQYVHALETIQAMGTPVVGFISRSHASWVIEMLQIGACERNVDGCAFCRGHSTQGKDGCALSGLRDRFLFDKTLDEPGLPPPLKPGERSALFQTSASLFQDYGANEPAMFYLNTGREIAQIQVPLWAARQDDLLSQVHALIYAQCVNGGGYPTALTRAHEQAVVTAADRDLLDAMVMKQLTELGIDLPVSEKARSKQARAI